MSEDWSSWWAALERQMLERGGLMPLMYVIVVPIRKDPLGLLASGRCGGPPALVESSHVCGHAAHQRWRLRDETPDCYMCSYPLQGLPLWWDGALVPEGWDRLVRVIRDANLPIMLPSDSLIHLDEVVAAATKVVKRGGADAVILLDEEGDRMNVAEEVQRG